MLNMAVSWLKFAFTNFLFVQHFQEKDSSLRFLYILKFWENGNADSAQTKKFNKKQSC